MHFFLLFLCSVVTIDAAVTKSLDELCSNSHSKLNNYCECELSTDQITHLPILNVDCTRINLKQDPSYSKIISNVHTLDLSHNLIETLDEPWESDSINTLKFAFNTIATIDVDYLQNAPNLENLDLSYNKINTFKSNLIFDKLKKLKYLNLSFNNLHTLPNNIFFPLQSLIDLRLGYNDLLGADLKMFNNVLSNKLGLNTNIERLNLDKLNIDNFHNSYFDDFHHLKYLSLADNPLPEVPSIPYSVTHLDLSGTNITVLAARYLNYHSLKVLKLNRLKELSTIDKYAFYNLQSLEELSINDCRKLKVFNDLVFGIVSKHLDFPLKRMSISRTGLQTLNATYAVLFEKLERLDLAHNHWRCDCSLLWLHKFKTLYKNSNDMRCLTPYTLANKPIMDLTPDDVNCNPYQSAFQRALLPVLLVVVFILICLIVYLIYMGPMMYRNKFRGIGPLSPYGIVTTQAE